MSKTSGSGNSGKRARKQQAPEAPEEALQMLQSAVSYCQQAGMAVRAVNRPAGLALLVPAAHFEVNDRDGTVFLPGAVSGEGERAGVLPYGYRRGADGSVEIGPEQAEHVREVVRKAAGQPRRG